MSVEEQLRTDFDKAAQEMPLASLSWDQTLSRARRGRMLRIASVSAAAAVLAATAVVGANTFTKPGPAPIAPASPQPSPTEKAQLASEAKEVVRRYVKAIGEGDAQAAWSEMSAQAREAAGSYERFEMLVSDTLQDGLGAFASAPDARFLVSFAVPVGQYLAPYYPELAGAVTISGTVASEDAAQPRLVVIPFVYDRDVRVQQSFDGHSAVFLSGKSADGELTAGGLFEATMIAPRGTDHVSFHIDGDGAEFRPESAERVSDGELLHVRLPGSITPGRHVLTMILIEKGTGNMYGSATVIEVVTP